MRAVLSLCLLAACAGHRVDVPIANEHDLAPGFEARPLIIPGERAGYLLHVAEVPVGRIEFTHGAVELRDGRPVSWINSLITSEEGIVDLVMSLRDDVSTCVDLETGIPVATRGSFVNLLSGRIDPDEDVEKPWPHQDRLHVNGHTLLLSLRGWDGRPGDRARTTLLSRTNANEVDLRFAGHEVISTELGPWPTVRVDGRIHGAASDGDDFLFSLWMADDASRAPLRLDSDTDLGLVASARIDSYSVP